MGAPSFWPDHVERAAYGAQHAQGQDVHLEQTQRVEVVLVPLDDAAVFHAGVFHRHQLRERVARDHKTARVLREVTRKADELLRQGHPQAAHRRFGVEAVFLQAFGRDAAAVEPVLALADGLDAFEVDAQGTAGITQRAARPVGR